MEVLILGMKWWGAGPLDFSRVAERTRLIPFEILDLNNRLDRTALRLRVGRQLVDQRIRCVPNRGVDLVVVMAPHRVSNHGLDRLRAMGPRVVAWLGDKPVAGRAFSAAPKRYDEIFAANPAWCHAVSWDGTWLPWPHVVPKELTASPVVPRGHYTVIGTAYPERIRFVEALLAAGFDIEVVGRGYPSGIKARAPVPRLRLLRQLRDSGGIVVNIPHKQMTGTFNPLFFDLAAAGVHQVLTSAPVPFQNLMGGVVAHNPAELMRISHDQLCQVTETLQAIVLNGHTVDDRIEAML